MNDIDWQSRALCAEEKVRKLESRVSVLSLKVREYQEIINRGYLLSDDERRLKLYNVMENVEVYELGLPTRITIALGRHNIITLGQLIYLSKEELERIPHVGKKSVEEIKTAVRRIKGFENIWA